MSNLNLKPWRALWIPLLALALFPLTFLNQLDPISQHPGREDGTWRSLNNYNLIFLSSWRSVGLLDSKLALSVPFDETDVSFSKPYSSYPPSYLLPLFAAEKFSANNSSSASLHRIAWLAALSHFLLACLAGYSAFLLTGQIIPAIASLVAALFLPPFLAFQHNIWWPDMAGLLAAALVLLASLHFRKERRGDLPLAATALLGSLLDWFTPLLAIALLPAASKRRRIFLLSALAFAILLFLGQQHLLHGLAVVAYKARIRTGWEPQNFSLGWHLLAWGESVHRMLGWGGLLLPPFVLAGAAIEQESRSRLRAIWPLYAAVLAHWLLFNQHYPGHHYNLVRWSFALALLPSLFPRRISAPASLLFLAWIAFLYPLFPASMEGHSTDLPASELAACRMVERHHGADRLFVSEEFSYAHELLGYLWYFPLCQSVVASAHSTEDIVVIMEKRFIRAKYTVAPIQQVFLLSRTSHAPEWAGKTQEVDHENDWHLFELPRP